MRSAFRVCVGIAVLSTGLIAAAQTPRTPSDLRAERVLIPNTKLQDATPMIYSIVNNQTGEVFYPDGQGGFTTRSPLNVTVFDSRTGRNFVTGLCDPNAIDNRNFADSLGNQICSPPDPNVVFFVSIYGLGSSGCDGPNEAGLSAPTFASFGIIDNLDIQWDDYVFDPIAGDPNQLSTDICGINILFGNFLNGSFWGPSLGLPHILQLNLGFSEFFDFDGDGGFCVQGGVTVNFAFGAATTGQFTSTIDLTGIGNLSGYNTGAFLYDFTDVVFDFDPNTGTTTNTPIGLTCAVFNYFAGGITNDPNCALPADLVCVGSVISNTLWLWANATQGNDPNAAPPWDPNFPIANSPCDPNDVGTTYGDILTNALLINITFFDGGTGRNLANSFPFRVWAVGGPACGPGCNVAGGDADVNDDCVVNLSDLAIVLANFGAGPGASHAQGDTNGDGFVNLTDLANVLALFGTACP